MIWLRHAFATCSRDLERLVKITRSPVYSHLISTIHGLKVIRSCHAENVLSTEFHSYLDNHTRVSYLVEILERWAAMRFNWISIIFIASVITLAIIMRIIQSSVSTVEIALTLTYTLNLVGIAQWTIRYINFRNKTVLSIGWKLQLF